VQATDLQLPNLHRGCTWRRRNKRLGFELLFEVTGAKWTNQLLGKIQWHKS